MLHLRDAARKHTRAASRLLVQQRSKGGAAAIAAPVLGSSAVNNMFGSSAEDYQEHNLEYVRA
jgi:hypothetical protein